MGERGGSYSSRHKFDAACALVALSALGCTAIIEHSPGGAEQGAAASTSSSAAEETAGELSASGIQASAPIVGLPSDYRGWPVFLAGVQRTDNGQVRDLYVNPVGATTQAGQPFPMGTVLVMDLFVAQKDNRGAPLLDAQGQLMKGALLKTLVMGKDTGWGSYVSSDMRNGDWLYSSYANDGKTLTADPLEPCFGCHMPLGASQDWVHRYGDYFQQRDGAKD